MKKSFSYRAAFAWNNLPCDVVSDYESLSTTRFKNLITISRIWKIAIDNIFKTI
jgi:hypothetical protein